MNAVGLSACSAWLLLLGLAQSTQAFEVIRFPGSVNTIVTGVDGGAVVGVYWDQSPALQRGFVYDGSSYQSVVYPGSQSTVLSGIDGNRVVGTYNASGGVSRGFVFDGVSYTDLVPPMASTTIFNGSRALGIDGERIVGDYIDDNRTTHGYLFDGTTFARFDFPGQANQRANDLDGDKIVGKFGDSTGYLFDGNAFQQLIPPGSNRSDATGIDGDVVVGYYTTNDPSALGLGRRGFFYERGRYRDYLVPASLGYDTQLSGVDGGSAVGYYRSTGGGFRGFRVAVPEPSAAVLLVAAATVIGSQRRRCVPR